MIPAKRHLGCCKFQAFTPLQIEKFLVDRGQCNGQGLSPKTIVPHKPSAIPTMVGVNLVVDGWKRRHVDEFN